MTDHETNKDSPPGSGQRTISGKEESDKDKLPEDCDPRVPPEATKLNKLTAEEQMALYEKELKEDDWGHQPC